MRTVIYIIWIAFPLIFFLIALWGWLERFSNRQKVHHPGDAFRQGLFVLSCSVIAFVIDIYILDFIVPFINQVWFPRIFLQVLLLPVILYVAALVWGPSKEILIARIARMRRFQGRHP